MKSWFLNNLGLKIISVILAVLVWWLIHSEIEANKASLPYYNPFRTMHFAP